MGDNLVIQRNPAAGLRECDGHEHTSTKLADNAPKIARSEDLYIKTVRPITERSGPKLIKGVESTLAESPPSEVPAEPVQTSPEPAPVPAGVNVDQLINYAGQAFSAAIRHGVNGHQYVDANGIEHFVFTRRLEGRITQEEEDYEAGKLIARRLVSDTAAETPVLVEQTGAFDAQGRLTRGQSVLVLDGAQPRTARGDFGADGRLVSGTIRTPDGSYSARVRTDRSSDGSSVRTTTVSGTASGSQVRTIERFDAAGQAVSRQSVSTDRETGRVTSVNHLDFVDGQISTSTTRTTNSAGAHHTTRVTSERSDDGTTLRATTVWDEAKQTLVRTNELFDAAGTMTARRIDRADPASGRTTSSQYVEFEGGSAQRSTHTHYDREGRRSSEATVRYSGGRPDKIEDVSYAPDGTERSARIFERSNGTWTLQLDQAGNRRFNLAAGSLTVKGGVPTLSEPVALARYDADHLVGFQLEVPMTALPEDPTKREAELDAFSTSMVAFACTLADGLSRYQPDVYALGFHGADDLRRSPQAFAGFMRLVRELADRRNATPVVTLSHADGRLYVDLISKTDNRTVVSGGRLVGDFNAGSVPGERGSPIGLYARGADGRGGPLQMLIYGPDRRFLRQSRTSETNQVTGSDLGGFWNTLGGIRQTESTDFLELEYGGPEEGWSAGRTVHGGSRLTYSSPNLLATSWHALQAGGESVVSLAGSVVASGMAAGLIAQELITRSYEETFLAAVDAYALATGDVGTAAAVHDSVWARRYVAEAQISDLGERAWDDLTLNPLVAGYAYGPADGARRRAASAHYLFNAPRELVEAAQATDGAERGFLLATALTAQVSLDFLRGIATFGPMAAALGSHALLQSGFHALMLGLAAHGAVESMYGDQGVLESLDAHLSNPTADTELALIRAVSHYSNAVVPFLAAAAPAALRGGRTTPSTRGGRTAAGETVRGELPVQRGVNEAVPTEGAPSAAGESTGAKPPTTTEATPGNGSPGRPRGRGPGLTEDAPAIAEAPVLLPEGLRTYIADGIRTRAAEGTTGTAPAAATGDTFVAEVGAKVLRYDDAAAANRAAEAFRDAGLDAEILPESAGVGENAIAVFTRPDPAVPADAPPATLTPLRYQVDPAQSRAFLETYRNLRDGEGLTGTLLADFHIHPPSGPRGTPITGKGSAAEQNFGWPGDLHYYRMLMNEMALDPAGTQAVVIQARPFYETDGFRFFYNQIRLVPETFGEVFFQSFTEGGWARDLGVLPGQ